MVTLRTHLVDASNRSRTRLVLHGPCGPGVLAPYTHSWLSTYQQCRLVHLGVQCVKAFTPMSSTQYLASTDLDMLRGKIGEAAVDRKDRRLAGIPAFPLRRTMKINRVAVWSQGSTNGRLNPHVTTASQQFPVKCSHLVLSACKSRHF
jgi:hypothetical protein